MPNAVAPHHDTCQMLWHSLMTQADGQWCEHISYHTRTPRKHHEQHRAQFLVLQTGVRCTVSGSPLPMCDAGQRSNIGHCTQGPFKHEASGPGITAHDASKLVLAGLNSSTTGRLSHSEASEGAAHTTWAIVLSTRGKHA